MFRISMLLHVFVAFHIFTDAINAMKTSKTAKPLNEVVGEKHRCYVCVPNTGSSISEVLHMFPNGPVVPLCNQFQVGDPEYIRECPSPSYQGCLTQTNGTHVTKMCTEAGVEDCKTANKIKYCYCKGDLCNREIVPVETPVSLETNEMPSSEAEDDEDSAMEGSGFLKKAGSRQVELGIEIIRKQTPTTTKSVILTTSRPDDAESKNSSVSICPRPMNFFYLISFLLVLRFF